MCSYFIDLIQFDDFIELCILNANDIFNPIHKIAKTLCPDCVCTDVNLKSTFYTSEEKYEIIKKFFPKMRVIVYEHNSEPVPYYIRCPWKDHGQECAYLNCLRRCVDYLNMC